MDMEGIGFLMVIFSALLLNWWWFAGRKKGPGR